MSKVGNIIPTLNVGRLWEKWLKVFDRQNRKPDCLLMTSNRNPMSEIIGKEAALIDPEDPIGFARNIGRLSAEEWHGIRRRLGMKNAKRFSFQAMITEYANLYVAMLPSYSSAAAFVA